MKKKYVKKVVREGYARVAVVRILYWLNIDSMVWALSFPLILVLLFGCVFFLESCHIPQLEKNTIVKQSQIAMTENESTIIPSVDTPKFAIEEILAIVKKHSPDCRLKIGTQNPGGCPCSATDLFVESEPIYGAKYTGQGVWIVSKECLVNPTVFNLNWYFYESSEELVIKND